MEKGDLHIHTTASDGLLSPTQVVRRAGDAGLAFLSLTDHNTVAGLAEGARALGDAKTQLVPGVELSSQPGDGDEIHLLGYGVDPRSEVLLATCRELCELKNRQLQHILRELRSSGVHVDERELEPQSEGAYVGRLLLADLLVQDGVVSSRRQAFRQWLGSRGDAYVPMAPFSPCRCIEAIHEAGGLAVLAHPTIRTVDRWIESLVRMGLDGVEVYRPGRQGNEQLYVEKAATHFGLFVTGGSDLHGRDGELPVGGFAVSRRQLRGFFAALGSGDRLEAMRAPRAG